MPKCQICFKGPFPPQAMRPIRTHQDPNAQQCLFCDENVDEVIVTGQDNVDRKFTKEKVISEYAKFLKELTEKKNIAEVLTKGKGNIITP